MKIFSIVVIILAVALIVFNATQINYDAPLEGKSTVALIGIVSGFCAIVLMLIFLVSKKIEEKTK
ncbi:MAG: hypothetical protein CMP76_01195 [Flavobacterium sp.]|uniref:hypothetical protein n=1 Tax=unclassified Flavobacterium TaxID=196869 RepID=UPI000C68A680|nr:MULTISPECIES: hypothetical protein [unclassified Flavobacterium]MBF01889.1 hypothetical protein [Flavobacterium sp.]MCO6161478.1 hypothetical protein [Flavobacterium sp. NRK F7]|tara:strand:- start:133 stop:327 length:195 start_codon:yes stop_codon:yes gene_type:complete